MKSQDAVSSKMQHNLHGHQFLLRNSIQVYDVVGRPGIQLRRMLLEGQQKMLYYTFLDRTEVHLAV